MTPPIAETEIGTERRCVRCFDWWPLDEEFFYRQANGYAGFQAVCKACEGERRGEGYLRQTRLSNRSLILAMLALGRHPNDVAFQVGCSVRTVYRTRGQGASAAPSSTGTIAA